MNPRLDKLQPYPFEKMRALLARTTPPTHMEPISLSIGEPAHPAPAVVMKTLADNLGLVGKYPATGGILELREAIATWATQRYTLDNLDPQTQVLPVNGTREALFAFAQTIVTPVPGALVLMPNPFYQIYEGAALLAGAEPLLLHCLVENQFQPDLDLVSPDQWERCQLFYICSPGNPTGAVTSHNYFRRLIELADEHDFVIASDECYSELYPDEDQPPTGLLQVCSQLGRSDYRRCVVFHSLSKRSNLPGLRSGFVAGDADALSQFLRYRTYHGCAMPPHHQMASIAAWGDEEHVKLNRKLYREKFDAVLEILSPVLEVERPDAGFYLWPVTPVPGEEFCRELYGAEGVKVLPGSFIGRDSGSGNPGADRVRLALVAPIQECADAALRIRRFIVGQFQNDNPRRSHQ